MWYLKIMYCTTSAHKFILPKSPKRKMFATPPLYSRKFQLCRSLKLVVLPSALLDSSLLSSTFNPSNSAFIIDQIQCINCPYTLRNYFHTSLFFGCVSKINLVLFIFQGMPFPVVEQLSKNIAKRAEIVTSIYLSSTSHSF
jgi:hypothetical protein